ncbi:MAG: hypothetical protein J0L64_24615 [Acidobacteria bacterium]|nr:hypothetical protein [Acidobacteriota bacterium]
MTHRPSSESWDERLSKVDWSQYLTAYGRATDVEEQLRRLRSSDESEALDATHDLWCGLCHQHVQIGSAALPALPFLLEEFSIANDQLKLELLDIFLGLAITSNPQHPAAVAAVREQNDPDCLHWTARVRSLLESALPSILPLRMHADPVIAHFAHEIAAELSSTNTPTTSDGDALASPSFDIAKEKFVDFLVNQGFPPRLLWVQPDDVVLREWKGAATLFVRKGDHNQRESDARQEFQSAAERGVGLALEASCKTGDWTICSIFVPENNDQAERLMVPRQGVKLSVAINPPPTVLVEHKWLWWPIKWLASGSPILRN